MIILVDAVFVGLGMLLVYRGLEAARIDTLRQYWGLLLIFFGMSLIKPVIESVFLGS